MADMRDEPSDEDIKRWLAESDAVRKIAPSESTDEYLKNLDPKPARPVDEETSDDDGKPS